MSQSTASAEIADELGLLLARYYVAIGQVIRQTRAERLKLKNSAVKLLGTVPADELEAYLVSHQSLVAQGFRKALVGPLQHQARDALGFSDADFEHIALRTPGNPDIDWGTVKQPTGKGTTVVGPAVTVAEGHVKFKLGAGAELAAPNRPPTLSPAGLQNAAGKVVKGVGIVIGVEIEC